MAKFRALATPREREWVGRLRAMHPKGWNSAYPGKPAAPGRGAPSSSLPPPVRERARDLAAALAVIRDWQADPRAARAWLRGAERQELIEVLEGLQKGLHPTQQTPITAAIGAEVREVLRKRKAEKRPRDFVRFLYGHRLAGAMDLPGIFTDPEVYKMHPEPEVAAAIMVVHRFAPQIASDLFNYKDWALHPAPMPPKDAATCPCHGQVLPGADLVDGHVLSTKVDYLSSPYLRDILARGKKYRLQQPVGTILSRLQEGLHEYTGHKKKHRLNDQPFHAALDAWAAAVLARAGARLARAARTQAPEPDGYPGLRKQLKAAQAALVFGPEDRAPHALFFACGHLYRARLHERLEQPGAFVRENRSSTEVLQAIKTLNEALGVEHHERLPYLYGGWKAKSKPFAGLRERRERKMIHNPAGGPTVKVHPTTL